MPRQTDTRIRGAVKPKQNPGIKKKANVKKTAYAVSKAVVNVFARAYAKRVTEYNTKKGK